MRDDDFLDQGRAGAWRVMPAVAFGVRAAALAGLVITAGAASAVAFGALDDPAAAVAFDWPGSTTCCPELPN
ncbi:hypothetical protein [Actinokineospora terrae]|uniref:Uncharacterized protein n=1 Tax=Actinokineospora terrae TaxID=155974 RepID=A0A1H9X8B6_9PSEU|nr:hypothetical protein [Actinokineospora terrae]SES42364.1 hypothetical protein SAMN04487818_113130 [Actinokineospora terrae]